METTAIQSANAVTATTVALANIRPNSFNPRRQFDDVALGELADSIRQQGVLQAIGLRPLQEADSYEIIYGERRYRASLLADKVDIPATIYNVTEEEAEEMAIAENLQRTDITPMEEANAYQRLLASGRHDVQSLSVQFGKSEAYIRTRLKFSALIPEIAALLDADEITVSVATEICRYSEDIQREVYNTHFENDNYSSWRGLKASEVARNIERDYTTNLRNYKFDKSACANCPHNTCNLLLFVEDGNEGKCANRPCLAEKNCAHLLASALSLISQYPTAEITQCRYSGTEAVTERLNEMGYEIADTYYQPTPLPTEPVAPIEADYDTPEEFAEEMARYHADLDKYTEEQDAIDSRLEAGEITLKIHISQKDVTIGYSINRNTDATDKPDNSPAAKIAELEKKDQRNKEIAREKTVTDTKERILAVDTTATKFGADEDRMMYYFMLSQIRKANIEALGIKPVNPCYLSEAEKMEVVGNLNARTKAIIRRDWLLSNFKDAFGSNQTATLLLDYARKHMPEELAEIERGYNEVYEKRHKRLAERIAEITATTANETEATTESEPTAEAAEVETSQPEATNPDKEEAA